MTCMNKKFFVIGCGSAGQRYMSILNTIYPQSEVIGVRREISTPLPCSPFFENIRHNNFISLGDLSLADHDYAIIANPNIYHSTTYAYIRDQSSTCRILIEKPVCTTAEDCERMSELEDPNSFVSFQYRYHPFLLWLRMNIQLLASVECFTANIEHMDNVKTWHPWEDFSQSYSVHQSLGGGCTHTLCHAQDVIHHLFPGSSLIVSQNGNSLKQIYPCDDWFSALYLHQSNPIRLFTSYVSQQPCFALSFVTERFSFRLDMLTPSFSYEGALPCKPPSLSNSIPQSPDDFRRHLFTSLLLDFMSTTPSTTLPRATSVARDFHSYC